MLGSFIVGNAATRQLSHPKSKICTRRALDILLRSKREKKISSASNLQCWQNRSRQTFLLLISTEEKSLVHHDRQDLHVRVCIKRSRTRGEPPTNLTDALVHTLRGIRTWGLCGEWFHSLRLLSSVYRPPS